MLQLGGKKMKYKIVSKGFNSRKLVPEDYDISNLITDPSHDYYESIYRYDEEHKKIWDQKKSLAGITGAVTKKLVFDFDSTNPEEARKDASELVSRLVHNGLNVDDMNIFWSGSKGFHVEVNTTDEFTRQEFESTINTLAGDLKTFDTKVKDENRIFRIPLTAHQKTKGYKIPLKATQLSEMPIEAIKAKSENITDEEWNTYMDMVQSEKIVTLPESITKFKKQEKKEKVTLDSVVLDDRPNLANKPKHLSAARFALQEGFFDQGERNEAYMILAATYKSLGYNKELAYNMLKATNRLQSRRTGQEPKSTDELWINVVEVVYGPSWRGAVYSEKENKLLIKTIQKYNLVAEDDKPTPSVLCELGGDSFVRYAKSFYETRIYTGLKELDEAFPICAGSNVAIVGAASSGKTAFSLNMLEQMKHTDANAVFASLDMSKSRLYEKLLYKVTGGNKSRDQIYQDYLNGKGQYYDELVKENFPNTYVFAKSAPTIDQLRYYIDRVQEHTGKPVRLLLIDYFERINSERSDDTAASKDVAAGIQDLIADYPELTPVTLYQPNKFSLGGGPDKPILNYTSIKGSGFVYQAARQILSLWRPFFSPEFKDYDQFMEMAILKNDLGELGTFKWGWDGKTGSIYTMSEDQKLQYAEWMKEKEQKEKGTTNNGDVF